MLRYYNSLTKFYFTKYDKIILKNLKLFSKLILKILRFGAYDFFYEIFDKRDKIIPIFRQIISIF